jgi:hypothetical protein
MSSTNVGRQRETIMRVARRSWRASREHQQGRWGYILAWALGVPIPVLLLVYLLRGCT